MPGHSADVPQGPTLDIGRRNQVIGVKIARKWAHFQGWAAPELEVNTIGTDKMVDGGQDGRR